MIADEGHTYAEVRDGALYRTFTADDTPEWDQDALYAVDISYANPKPQVGWLWSAAGFFAPERALVDRQTDRWTLIKSRRSQAEAGGIQVGSDWYQTDDVSRIKYLGLKDAGRDVLATGGAMGDPINEAGTQVRWKTYANTLVPMTVQLAFDLVAAVRTLDAQAYYRAEVHRLTMLQAADPDTYDYSAGWPAAYPGA